MGIWNRLRHSILRYRLITLASSVLYSVPSLAWIIAIGLVVRLGLWANCQGLPVRIVDAQDYNRLAVGLIEFGDYLGESGESVSLRPPLYPCLVALIYGLFGIENYQAVRLFQCLLSLVTSMLTYQLATALFSRRTALWASGFVCFSPSLLGVNYLLLSETLFTFLIVAAAVSAVTAIRHCSLGWLAFTGIILGLGALTRSVLLLFVPTFSCYLILAWPSTATRRLLAALIPFLAVIVVVSPWSIRNTHLQKTFVAVDVMGGRNAMMGNYEYTPLERSWATIDAVANDRSWYSVLSAQHPEVKGMTQGQIDKLALKHGLMFVLAHPGLTLKRDIIKFFNFWQLDRTLAAGMEAGHFGDTSRLGVVLLTLLTCGAYAIGLISALIGFLIFGHLRPRLHALMLLFITIPCIAHTLTFAHSRYCLPLLPILLCYSAAVFVDRKAVWKERNGWPFRMAVFLSFVLLAGWTRELIIVDLEKFLSLLS